MERNNNLIENNAPAPNGNEINSNRGTNFWDTLKYLIGRISLTIWMIIISIIMLILIAGSIFVWINSDNGAKITQNKQIDITPTQIQSIEQIGEWEFLSVSDEELIDTVRRGFFGDDNLVRIYYGTLRLGVNLHEANPGWIKADGDTIVAVMPQIKLLDNDFIDEARTRSFYEEGKWSNADRQTLYNKAYQKMKQRCLTPQNISSAQQNASAQMTNLLRNMGFEYVKVRFEEPKEEKK